MVATVSLPCFSPQTRSDHLEHPLVDAKLRLLTCRLPRRTAPMTREEGLWSPPGNLLCSFPLIVFLSCPLSTARHLTTWMSTHTSWSDLLAEIASSVRVSQSVGDAKHCWLHRIKHSCRHPLPCGSERVSGFLGVRLHGRIQLNARHVSCEGVRRRRRLRRSCTS